MEGFEVREGRAMGQGFGPMHSKDRADFREFYDTGMAMADAEGFHAPEGNRSATDWARWGRSAGVLRPWQAGRATATQHVGSPRRSWTGTTWEAGIQFLRPRRGNPAPAQGWHRRSTVAQGPGKRRRTVTGTARRLRLGCLRPQRTPRGGKPTPGGRT